LLREDNVLTTKLWAVAAHRRFRWVSATEMEEIE